MENFKTYLFLFFGMFLFGSATPLSKIIAEDFSVFFAGTMRIFLATLFFLPFVDWSILKKMTRKDLWFFIGIGVIGVVGFTIFMLYGMKKSSGVGGSIVMSTAPAITAILSVIFFKDKLGWQKIVALALGISGVFVLNYAGSEEDSQNSWIGIVLILAAVFCDAAYTLFGKKLSKEYRAMDIAGISTLFGFLAFLPFLLISGSWPDWSETKIESWIYLFVYGVIIAGLGAYFWYKGVKKVKGSTAAGFMAVMPLSALTLSYVLLNEKFEWWHLLGFGLVFIGVMIIVRMHIQKV